jgi:hypothetical protein
VIRPASTNRSTVEALEKGRSIGVVAKHQSTLASKIGPGRVVLPFDPGAGKQILYSVEGSGGTYNIGLGFLPSAKPSNGPKIESESFAEIAISA